MAIQTYVFVKDENENTFGRATKITPKDLFDSKVGYGFITEENRNKEELLHIPELNSGLTNNPETDVHTCIKADDKGCFVENGDTIPLIFKAEVSRMGNYEISMTLFGKGEVSVFSGCRNLVYLNNINEETEFEVSFNVKLISIIPNKKSCMYENRSVDIAVFGSNVRLRKLTVKESNCPTLFIAGDNYISNHLGFYPFSRKNSTAGWGQMLPVCVKKGIACYNYAKDSLSMENFRGEGHFSLAQAHMKLGDYLLLHFAANEDENKLDSFIQEMTDYIDEARAMGVYPILVTPVECLKKNEKKSFDSICRELSSKLNVPYIDISGISRELVNWINADGNLDDEGALNVAKSFSEGLVSLMEGARPDPYTKLAKFFL